jgi:hypothetical protein
MIPAFLQGVLWNVGVGKLDLRKDKNYIVHQVLAYGNLEHLHWLFQNYSKQEIVQTFLKSPAKDYTPAAFNFVKNLLLGLKGTLLDERKYVKTFPRIKGQRGPAA